MPGRFVDTTTGSGSDPTNARRECLESLLPVSNGRCGRWQDHRQVVNGLLFRIRTGVRWRDPPKMSPPGAQRGGAPSEASSSVPHRPCEGSQHDCRAGAALWE
ncbi:transposase [Streptomyces sp. NPDC015350]|uniref:transposase n=1 Tax=Streptomyces sp. NPDC015350 TaxID=3364955 RepID=UPI003700D404